MRLLAVAALSLSLVGCGDGDDGIDSLVDVSAEAAGSNCENGGVVIRTGFDDNGNGALDADEVQDTNYICEEAPVENPASLSSLTAEGAGSNCQYGGVAVSTGVDDDLDGVLDPEEIDSTTYVCNGTGPGAVNPVLEGDVTITSALEATMLTRFSEVTGNLTIEGVGLFSLDLSNLTTVGGHLAINEPELDELNVSSLQTAGALTINAPMLATFDFPSLTTVDGIGGNGNLDLGPGDATTAINLPLLASTDGRVELNGAAALTSFVIPELATVGGRFRVQATDVLVTLSAPKLTTTADFWVRNNTLLSTIEFPLLTSVDAFRVRDNPALCDDVVQTLLIQANASSSQTQNNDGACP